MDQPRLLGAPWFEAPPRRADPRAKDHALEVARTATRRARERALTATPAPTAVRVPAESRPMSQGVRTVGTMPRGGRRAEVEPAHGTRARYNNRRYLCRCPACRDANNVYMARYRAETAPDRTLVRRSVVTVRPDQRLL